MSELNFADLIPQELEPCKYCQLPCDPYNKPALKCSGQCSAKVHVSCLKSRGVPGSIIDDVFFKFVCIQCNSTSTELIVREKLSWLTIIILTLHQLREKSSGLSRLGYFHRTAHICQFINKNWDLLFPKGTKPKKKWMGTVSGVLSVCKQTFFESGTVALGGKGGWWKLRYAHPPEILMAMNTKMITERKPKGIDERELSRTASPHSAGGSESSLSCEDDSNGGESSSRVQTPSMFSREYVQPSEMLSDFLFADDEIPDIDLLNMELDGESLAHYKADHCDLFSNTDWISSFPVNDKNNMTHEAESMDMTNDQEDSSDDSIEMAREPIPSLFTINPRREWPWRRKIDLEGCKRPPMGKHAEEYLLQNFNKADLDKLSPAARRLYRKLAIRKAKLDNNLTLFDLSRKSGAKNHNGGEKRVMDRFVNDNLNIVFEQRLQGYCEPTAVHSPYTNRLLKPFIRRDTNCRPLWLRVMDELRAKVNRKNPNWQPEPCASIDYCYVRPQHIPAINGLCNLFFYPGIDVTECLQYPDFTCVVLYKKLVIGFAALVPDVGYNEAYISFFVTRPEWRRSGIGTFMLYHLIQTCMGKDITLHVSATNPAVILYQKFGFKIEEFVQDFYDKYVSSGPKESRHALFLRLNR